MLNLKNAFFCCLLALLVFCEQNPNGSPGAQTQKYAPVVTAGPYAITGIGQPIALSALASDSDGSIVAYEWFIEGSAGFVTTSGPDTTITAPPQSDESFTCIVRVTDNDSLQALDTVIYWVVETMAEVGTRIISPRGGEVFIIGDTFAIELWPSQTQIGIKLMIDDDREYNLLAGGSSVVPATRPVIKMVLPATINGESLVSENCRIQAYEYSQPGQYVESENFFAIRAPETE